MIRFRRVLELGRIEKVSVSVEKSNEIQISPYDDRDGIVFNYDIWKVADAIQCICLRAMLKSLQRLFLANELTREINVHYFYFRMLDSQALQ